MADMSPLELKAMAIACALLSLALLVTVATRWSARSTDNVGEAAERSGWRGGLTLFAISLLVLVSLLLAAGKAGWPRDRALWIGVGTFLGFLTLIKPWWFWENWKARWLRGLIGDTATVLVYLALAAAMVWIGMNTNWTFGKP
jgi:hypothetical protein